MNTTENAEAVGAGPFPALIIVGFITTVLGFILPLSGGTGAQSVMESDPGGTCAVLAVFGIPMLIGVIAWRTPLLAGLAAGSALLFGAMCTTVWSVIVGLALEPFVEYPVGAGLVMLVIGSLLLMAAAFSGQRFRRVGMPASAATSPVAVLGIVAGLLTVVGVMIPPDNLSFAIWSGYEVYEIVGVAFAVLLGSFLFIVFSGFLGGRWGVGLVLGLVGIVGSLAVLSDPDETSLADDMLFGGNQSLHELAKFGFLALAVLWVVHALITLGASTTTTATPTFVLATVTPVAESNPARWAADPHGRHELRYWNGTAWTDDVSDRGVVSNETFRAAAPAAPRVEAPWASFDSETTVPRYAPPTTIPPTVAATPSVVLRFDSGLVHQLGGGVVVGRDPTLVAHVPAALLVQYADPTMSVSKTHLVLGPDGLDAWVEDLGSSNGTEVTTSGGHRIAVAPGQRLPVNRGATVHFGDRWVRVE